MGHERVTRGQRLGPSGVPSILTGSRHQEHSSYFLARLMYER